MTIAFRYGNPAVDRGGAQLRAQCRHLATVATLTGVIDDANFERLTHRVRQMVLTEKPFVLDLSGVTGLSARGVSLLYGLDDECDLAGVEWALVGSPAVLSTFCNSSTTPFRSPRRFPRRCITSPRAPLPAGACSHCCTRPHNKERRITCCSTFAG